MQFQLKTNSFTCSLNRLLTATERVLNTAHFLTNCLPLITFENENCIRSLLAALPLLLSKQLDPGSLVYTPGKRQSLRLARFYNYCGTALPSTRNIDLRVPPRKDVKRFYLARNSGRVLGEGLQRRREIFSRGEAEFKKFLSVWCAESERKLRKSPKIDIKMDRIIMVLRDMGTLLHRLVFVEELYHRNTYAELAFCVHHLFGETRGMDFWRLANFPGKWFICSHETYLENSCIQKELRL
uniref:p0 protein n=1 Tax=Beet mild yellowing virus TaxID=156690 RepID=B5KL78_9VIRU|nr:P0 protein [Beet mild yellowing virus]